VCVCAEVQPPGLSIYVVSCYFQRRNRGPLQTPRKDVSIPERFIVTVDVNARLLLWDSPETDERGRKFDLHLCVWLWNNKRSLSRATFEEGIVLHRCDLGVPSNKPIIDTWKVRREWTTSNHSPVEIGRRTPRTANDRRTASIHRFDIRRADWIQWEPERSRSRLGILGPKSAEEAEIMAEELQEVILEAKNRCREKEFSKSQIRGG